MKSFLFFSLSFSVSSLSIVSSSHVSFLPVRNVTSRTQILVEDQFPLSRDCFLVSLKEERRYGTLRRVSESLRRDREIQSDKAGAGVSATVSRKGRRSCVSCVFFFSLLLSLSLPLAS